MEGCPRSLMLNVDLKESFPTELTPSLKTYIREHYNEDADSYKNECSQLEQLRTASLRPSRDHSGCSTLRRYYAQLQFLQSRFPMGDGGAVNVQFTWTDLYSEEPIGLCDIKFEQASILHNLAALHSQLGCQEDRTAEEGMKVACTHFQAAAGIFQYLKAGSFCKVEHFIDHFANDAFFDMASGLLQLYINVMLGQAQECLLEKSILDSRKDSLIARISMQVYDYYNQALQFLDSQGPSYMGSRKAKIWTKNLKIKCCQFLAVAYIYMSNNADENQKFGEKVAYLKAASQKITEAQKASKGQPEKTQELLQFLVDVVSNKLHGAVKDNDFIYHEIVPELDALPEIKAAPLVKPIPFQPGDPSVAGPDIFQRLIPMDAHTDSSLYSEEKAQLLRRYVGSIEQKNQLLSKALNDLHIDDLLEPEGYDILPAAIIEKSNSLKRDGSLKEVENNVEELTKVGAKVEESLESLAKILEEDKRREKELEELVGPMTPPPEREDFEKELEQCQASHKKATQTNTELLKVFNEHKHNLDLLVGPSEGLLAALPSLNIIDTPIDDGAVQRLRDLISKVEEMKSQRKKFEADLRKQLADDDITQLLVTREEGNKTLFFEEQLKKHSATCDLIQKNLDAQPKILKALTEANAKYAPTRQAVKETAQRRDDAVQAFVFSHGTFFELKEKLSRGLRFYQGLEKTVLKLEEKLKEFAANRKKKMDKIEEKEKEKKAKEKAKTPPARPGASKPEHLVNPPASSVPSPMPGQYLGGPGMPHPGMRPGVPNPTTQGVPLQPRIPGGAFPPGAFPGATPPRPADPRVYPAGSQGVPGRPPVPPGDQRMQVPRPGFPPQNPPDSRPQPTFPEQRVPQVPSSPASGPPMHPSMQPRPAAPFSQVGPRGPGPTEHLIHSTPRMSYPTPQGPSVPPGGPQGFQAGVPGRPYQAPPPPAQQPRPQLLPVQVPGSGSAQGLPSYDQAKFMPGSQPVSRPQQPPVTPQQGWSQGQLPSTSQQQPGGQQLPPNQLNPQQNFTPQQQFQGPRGPHLTSQPQHPSQVGSPQRYQQQIPSSQMSQPLQPTSSQHQPKSWPTQPFQFPKLAQQTLQPQQPQQQFQQPQQPYQRPQQQPQQPHPQQQFQQPLPGHPQFPQPLQPQKVPQPQPLSQIPQQFQPQQPSQPQQRPQQPPQFQQQQPPHQQLLQPPQPPQHFQQPMQQFKQPGQFQPQFSQPQQQMQHPREPLQPTQFQQTLQTKGQQQQQQLPPSMQPQQSYQQQLQPLEPQKPTQQSQYQPPLQPQPHSMQQPLQGQQFPTERVPQQTPHPGLPSSQNLQSSLGPLKPQKVDKVPEIPPKSRSQMGQMPGPPSWQQQSSNPPPKPPHPGHPAQQPYPGYSQQSSQTSNTSTQLGYPVLPEKKRSQTDQLPSKPPQEGFPPQHPGLQSSGSLEPSPHPQNTNPGSLLSWPYPQASQPLSSTGALLNNQQFSRQDSKEQKQGYGGKQLHSAPQPTSYKQPPVAPGWGAQQPPQGRPAQEPAAFPPVVARQDSAEYGKQNQYPGQSRSRVASYPPYGGGVSQPPSALPAGSQPYSFTTGSTPTAPPLVQGVRPSPASLPPSSAYATSYSVSVAQAQLSQQQQMQQMQQLQTQMLLQQQQLIIQQQELLRHQQQQQHHESDQGHLTQLFQQVLQQQTKLAEMEQKLVEHERQEEQLKKEHEKIEHDEPPSEKDKDTTVKNPPEKDKDAAEKDSHATPPHSSSSYSASWGSGFSDLTHGKLDMDQVFSDLAKKQISEISEMSKHTDGNTDSSRVAVHEDNEADATREDSEHSNKELVGDENTDTKGKSGNELNSSTVTKETTQVINTEIESIAPEEESNKEKESSSSIEPKADSSSSTEGKPHDAPQTEHPSDEDKEKRRRQEIEEQIQKIKELQKNTQPGPPPLPQKQKYLYEPGKMPELPLKPPDTVTTADPNKPPLHRQCGHYYNTQRSSIGQEENNECLSEDEYIQRLTHTVETFEALVVSLGQKRENALYNGFINEWKVLEKLQEEDSAMFSTQAATLNPSKNRYRDVLPWDHTRVKLTTKEGGDYINASAIKKVTPLSPDYILTQGPVAATLGDFWLMVWEQKAPVIVMLTKEVEGNRLKCHQYWPIDEGHTVVYGAIRVHMRSVNHCQAWIERIMHVQHAESDEVLVVSHLQFVGWPDHGVPHSPSDLLTFLSEVHNHHEEKDPQAQSPLVVHCSAGVGRAGTFCIIYTAIRELHGTRNIVNIPKLVRIFRRHRKFTVQKKEQYEFCYRAILFYANQFVQLEKTAIDFKKSKVASCDQQGDVNHTSPASSFSGSGQRKPGDVSFLGEISDEDSSDSDDEFDKEENGLNIGWGSQGFGKGGLANEYNRTDKQSSELKEGPEMTVKDITTTSEVSVVSTNLSTTDEQTEGKLEVTDLSTEGAKLKDSSVSSSSSITGASSACETSTVSGDLLATNQQTEGRLEMEDSSPQDAKLRDSSCNSTATVNGVTGDSLAPTSSSYRPEVTGKCTEKVDAKDSIEKQKDCSGERTSCADDEHRVVTEFVQDSLSEEQVTSNDPRDMGVTVEETKMDPALEKDADVKRDDVKVKDCDDNAQELADSDPAILADRDEERTVEKELSDEKSSSVEQPSKEDLPEEDHGNESGKDQSTYEEGEKPQENEMKSEAEGQVESLEKELIDEKIDEKQPEDQAQDSEGDKLQTGSLKDHESNSLEQT